MIRCNIETSLGVFAAQFSESGLVRLQFPSQPSPAASGRNNLLPPSIRVWERRTAEALRAILRGRVPGRLPPMDWSTATPFQRAVWAQLHRIPPGQVRTYTQVAQAIGRPQAARAVGTACGVNPIPVLVPCHRVVAADGGLGGFSGGLSWKMRLLALDASSSHFGPRPPEGGTPNSATCHPTPFGVPALAGSSDTSWPK